MFTDHTGDALKKARNKIHAAENLIYHPKRKNIHWHSLEFQIMDKKKTWWIFYLDFPEKIPLIARIDGGEWYSFNRSHDYEMSGKEFKRAIDQYARKRKATMIEVKRMFNKDGTLTENDIVFIKEET